MSLFADIVEFLRGKSDAELQAIAGVIGVAPAQGAHDALDANLATLVAGIHPGRPESAQRVILAELVAGAPEGDAKRLARANIANANGLYMFTGEKTCAAYSKLNAWGYVDTSSPHIPNTIVAAEHDNRTGADVCRTVVQFHDAMNALADLKTSDGAGFLGN